MEYHKRNHVLAVLKAMANANRLKILEQIKVSKAGSLTVSELVDKVGIEQSVISAHLNIMRLSKVVQAKQNGKHMHYSIKDSIADYVIGLLK